MRQSTKYILSLLLSGCCSTGVFAQTYSLEQCKEFALKNNTAIKNNQLQTQGAEQTKREAFTKYFPSVNMMGSSFGSSKALMDVNIKGGNLPVYDGNPANLASATQFAYFPDISMSMLKKGNIASVTAMQPVYAGGRIVNGNKLANIGLEAQRISTQLSVNEVSLQTEQFFWQIVALEEKLKTIGIVESLLDNLLKDVNVSHKAGLISMNDVLKVKLKRNELAGNKLKVQNGIKLSKMALCQYIGMPFDTTMAITYVDTDFKMLPEPHIYATNSSEALVNRPEYKLLQKNVEASKLQTRMKRGEYLPEAGVGASYVSENLMGSERHYGIAFATVKVPVSDWWGGYHAINRRKVEEKIALNNQQNANEQMLLQIQQTWNELEESYKQIKIAEESVQEATENHRLNADCYKVGTVSLSDLLTAQVSLQQSRDLYVDACTDYLMKRTKYLQATGR